MTQEEIRQVLAKPATKFETGGFRSSGERTESWIGRVFLFRQNEELPKDFEGKSMLPLAQLYVGNLQEKPTELDGIELLTIFISTELPDEFEPMGKRWEIREYTSLDSLISKDLEAPNNHIKAFPLKPIFETADYPLWDSGNIPDEIEDEVIKLEDAGKIESYYDLIEHIYLHKVGGYPSFCQSGVDFGDGYEFVCQMSSEQKSHFNVVDSGSLMFAKNKQSGEWNIYYDFY